VRDRISRPLRPTLRRQIITLPPLSLAMLQFTRVAAKGRVETRDFSVQPYHGISMRFPADFDIRSAANDRISISAESEVLEALRIGVKDGILIFDAKNFQTTEPIKVRIEARQLNLVRIDSSGNIALKDLNTERLSVESSASAHITMAGLICDSLKLTASGAETVKIAGRAKTFELKADGSSDIDASKFEAQSVTATVSGASSASVKSVADLRATASDSATIKYHGGGRISKRVSDAAEVIRIN
jgi:Putative auto-transporter adhesin, head GIN domain